MNPPFSVAADRKAYIAHVLHAWELLAQDGVLVAIVPSSVNYNADKRSSELRDLVMQNGGNWCDLEAAAFKESGTNVATCVLWLTKRDQSWKNQPYQGWHCWHCWNVHLQEYTDGNLYDKRLKMFEQLGKMAKAGQPLLIPTTKPKDATRGYQMLIAERVVQMVKWHFQPVAVESNKQEHIGIFLTEQCFEMLALDLLEEYANDPHWEVSNSSNLKEALMLAKD